MRQAVDQVTKTNRPTYVISRFPFRAGGHANDANPAPEAILLDQYGKLRETLLDQVCAA